MITPGTLYKFTRNDLISALESLPQQSRPVGLRRMDKATLQGEVLRLAKQLPDLADRVEKMADRREPGGFLRMMERRQSAKARKPSMEDLAAMLGPCGK